MMQGDLGQSRSELAGAGDEQAELALATQGRREIFRLAEHRGNAARHLSSPRRLGAGRTRLPTGNVLPLTHRSCRVCFARGYSLSAEMRGWIAEMLNVGTLASLGKALPGGVRRYPAKTVMAERCI